MTSVQLRRPVKADFGDDALKAKSMQPYPPLLSEQFHWLIGVNEFACSTKTVKGKARIVLGQSADAD